MGWNEVESSQSPPYRFAIACQAEIALVHNAEAGARSRSACDTSVGTDGRQGLRSASDVALRLQCLSLQLYGHLPWHPHTATVSIFQQQAWPFPLR